MTTEYLRRIAPHHSRFRLELEDVSSFKEQDMAILRRLLDGEWHSKRELELASGSERVAARIYIIDHVFEIESEREQGTRTAKYRLLGKRGDENPKQVEPHCASCTCEDLTRRVD